MSRCPLNHCAGAADTPLVAVANWYPDPTSAGQLRYWDGSAWTPHVVPAAIPAHAVTNPNAPYAVANPTTPYAPALAPAQVRPGAGYGSASPASLAVLPYGADATQAAQRRHHWTLVAAIAVGLVLGLVAIRLVLGSLHVTTFVTHDNSIDEFGYSQTVRSDMVAINRAAADLHPACDKGGQLQGCYDADRMMIATLTDVHDGLARATVPTRYAGQHRQLLAALVLDAQAFAQRNHAIETHSNAEWQTSNDAIGKAETAINAALHAYPAGTVTAGP